MIIDILARQAYYLPHLAPVWHALAPSERGVLYLPGHCIPPARKLFKDSNVAAYEEGGDCGRGAILTASYGDYIAAARYNPNRPLILTEHGIGLTFGKAAYADGVGQRAQLENGAKLKALFLIQSEYVKKKIHPDLQHLPHPVIGMPKLDYLAGEFTKPHPMPDKPTVAIAFHHGDKNSRPGVIGSAWEHYIEVLPELAVRYKLITHAHPSQLNPALHETYQRLGLEYVPDFADVMKRADIYLNDSSSTLYEFLATGKPVVLLNAPWFYEAGNKRKDWGIRFWDYSDVGPQVDDPYLLTRAIDALIAQPDAYRTQRTKAVSDLLPFIGSGAERAVEAIGTWLGKSRFVSAPEPEAKTTPIKKLKAAIRQRRNRTTLERGILYMVFGPAALEEAEKSIKSLRAVGCTLPIAVTGSEPMAAFENVQGELLKVIPWTGEDPFDQDAASHFQFRAGRVKPSFYQVTPFKETMYVDCDLTFKENPEKGFGFLEHWDFVIAQERLNIGQLYNRPRVNWHHNIAERDATIVEFGGDGKFPFVNSGVFFWKQNKENEDLFALWGKEWLRFQMWCEQSALLRALNKSKVRVLVLSELWNYPHTDNEDAVIVHLYGQGDARVDAK